MRPCSASSAIFNHCSASFFLLVIIVVGISRRYLVAYDSEETPVDRPSRNTFKGGQDHVGSFWTSRHSRSDVTVRDRGRPDMECAMASHKFHVGEIVSLRPVVSRNVPGNGREFEYRIKSAGEPASRI